MEGMREKDRGSEGLRYQAAEGASTFPDNTPCSVKAGLYIAFVIPLASRYPPFPVASRAFRPRGGRLLNLHPVAAKLEMQCRTGPLR